MENEFTIKMHTIEKGGKEYFLKEDAEKVMNRVAKIERKETLSKELDKAREEGRREGMVGMLELAEKHSFPLSVVLNNKEIARKLKELSKLKQ